MILSIGALAGWPPVDYLSSLSEHIKTAWIKSPKDEPPFGHAELLSVQSLSRKMRIDADAAVIGIRQAGFKVDAKSQTLAQIAAQDGGCSLRPGSGRSPGVPSSTPRSGC